MISQITHLFFKRNTKYDDEFFNKAWFDNWLELKHVLKELIVLNSKWKTILDFGCGPGVMIDLMNSLSYRYLGYDKSNDAKSLYLEHFGLYPDCYVQSLDKLNLDSFNLFLSFDVFEHMTDSAISEVLSKTKQIPDYLFNISRNRSTPGHINIKKDKQWINFFQCNGLIQNRKETEKLRERYKELRPDTSDLWNRNLFVFMRN